MINLTVEISNYYEDDTVINVENVTVSPPDADEDTGDWAYDNLFVLTGTGRHDGNAGYQVEILHSPDMPELVGNVYEWGI